MCKKVKRCIGAYRWVKKKTEMKMYAWCNETGVCEKNSWRVIVETTRHSEHNNYIYPYMEHFGFVSFGFSFSSFSQVISGFAGTRNIYYTDHM